MVNPFLTNLATNLQSQNLYAGWAMTQGQVPYSQIYGTSGLLYYLMAWTSSLAFGQLLWMVFQTLALWLAGLFLHKTLVLLQPKQDLSAQPPAALLPASLCPWNLAVFYSSIFVLPFIFWNLSFLVRYLQDSIKDEKFIVYGAFGALAFMIDPVSSLVFYFFDCSGCFWSTILQPACGSRLLSAFSWSLWLLSDFFILSATLLLPIKPLARLSVR